MPTVGQRTPRDGRHPDRARRASRAWPGLRVVYAWRPPFEGEAVTQPNRLEVVFSAHPAVELGQDGRAHRSAAEAGAAYVVGPAPTVLRRVADYSDTLEIYPDLGLTACRGRGRRHRRLRARSRRSAPARVAGSGATRRCSGWPTGCGARSWGGPALRHRGEQPRAPAGAAGAGAAAPAAAAAAGARSTRARLARVAEAVEARLAGTLTSPTWPRRPASAPSTSPAASRPPPGSRRTSTCSPAGSSSPSGCSSATRRPVRRSPGSAGFENVSHFRRQFAAQVGVLPGALRRGDRRRA